MEKSLQEECRRESFTSMVFRISFPLPEISVTKKIERQKENLILELQKALSEVKILRGFIPICANCKKIRDDQGYWKQVEKYVSDRTEGQFSHGLCPNCMKELYPQLRLAKKLDD